MRKVLIIFISIIFLCGCNNEEKVSKKQDNQELNITQSAIKDQKIEDLEFINSSIIEKEGINTFTTTIINNSKNVKKLSILKVSVKDKDGVVIEELLGYIDDSIKSNESKIVTISTTGNLKNAYSVEYKLY